MRKMTIISYLASVFACASIGFAAETLAPTPVSGAAPMANERSATGSLPDVARRSNCHEIDVELDEGYGVSSHATRSVCDPAS
jgi:hypothetical protein